MPSFYVIAEVYLLKVELSQSQRMVFLGEALKMEPITITIDTIASNKNILVNPPLFPSASQSTPQILMLGYDIHKFLHGSKAKVTIGKGQNIETNMFRYLEWRVS